MTGASTLIAVALLAVTPAERAVASAEYNAGLARGQELRFLWQPAMDADLTAAVMYQVPAASRQALLDGTVPVRVPGTSMLAIDLNQLGWKVEDWQAVCGFQANGYAKAQNPLIVPAGYLLNEIADGREKGLYTKKPANAYLRFVFSGKVPKTEDEFLAAFGIDRKKQGGLQFGWVEGESGVNVTEDGARLAEHSSGTNVTAWVTYDVEQIGKGSDPLEGLFAGRFKHDASEWFVLSPKVSADGTRGVFPFTGLANGEGAIQAEAPVTIVRDATETFGSDAIVNPGGCVSCHNEGSKRPSVNALKHLLTVDHHGDFPTLRTYKKQDQIAVDLFHGGDATKALARWDEDYAAALKAVNGLTPLENATAYRAALKAWNADVTPEKAAQELSTDVQTLELAIGWAQKNYVDVGPRVVKLASGEAMPRDTFEGEYLKLQSYLEAYRK